MKTAQFKRLVTMLLLVTAMAMPKMAWAEITPTQPSSGDGTSANPYQISNAEELYWFAALVNGTIEGETPNASANAVLIANIIVNTDVLNDDGTLANNYPDFITWIPIGSPYEGTFDGRGHTISGLYFNDSNIDCVGLFGNNSGTIQNVGVVDSYFNGKNYVGGVCGQNQKKNKGGVTLANCYNTGTVSGTSYVGGVCGYNFALFEGSVTLANCYNTGTVNGSNQVGGVCGLHNANYQGAVTITNCYNTGTVSGTSYVGGVCGNNSANQMDGKSTITNCYNTSTVSGTSYVGGVCGQNYSESGGKSTITNCYYYSENYTGNAVGKNNATINTVTAKTATQFESGEVCYLLNDSVSDGSWGQTLSGTDKQDYPVLGGDKVYYGYADCDENKDQTYSNTELADTRPKHNYVNGFCTKCGAYQPATDSDSDGVYEIGNAGQLYWFAALVNGTLIDGTAQNLSANAVLTADITVNTGVLNADGTLVSNTSSFKVWTPIKGSGYPDYAGTFDGQNHTVSGLYFNNTKLCCVGLFGSVGEGGKVSNVGVVDSYFCGAQCVGGICGDNEGTVENCYSTSTVGGEQWIGGICGMIYSGDIKNCYNTGAVSGTYTYVGGVCGGSGGNIINCYSTGEVTATGAAAYVGGVCGDNSGTITNCYFDSSKCDKNAVGSNDGTVEKTEGTTTTQFASGEVCYLLNGNTSDGAWGQTIGTDPYPVLGGLPVYFRDEVYTNTYGILTIGTQTITASNEPLVWYEFTPSETASYKFSSTQLTAGNLYVNTTKTESDYTDIATSPTYDLEAATTYYVAVSGAPGSYDLTITRINNTPTAMEAVTAPQIYAVDGRIVCNGEFRIYDLLGRDVTCLNGSLRGVYVVKTTDAAQKVVVR